MDRRSLNAKCTEVKLRHFKWLALTPFPSGVESIGTVMVSSFLMVSEDIYVQIMSNTLR